MTREAEIAWLAGIMEGEGSFGAVSRGKSEYAPRVALCMTDRDVVIRAFEIADCGRIYGPYEVLESNVGPGPFKKRYQWIVQGKEAIAFMELVLPYMFERRATKIQEILSVYEELEFRKTLLYKFWSNVVQVDSCWAWQKDKLSLWHETKRSPRLLAFDLCGLERPGRSVRDVCGNSKCVNPMHMEAGNALNRS